MNSLDLSLMNIRTALAIFTISIGFSAHFAQAGEMQSLQGTWTPAKAELAGNPMPTNFLNSITLTIKEGTYEAIVGTISDKGTFKLDTASKPKGMTITGSAGPNAGKAIPAIYEVEADTLRVCYDLSAAHRPSDFKTVPGTQLYLVTYRRKK
jgi:uncharacterized protein (TIGR03067 family)